MLKITNSTRLLSAAAFMVLTATTATAQTATAFPSKPVRVIVPYPAGGGIATVGQILSPKLNQDTGQNFIFDSRPGGNTIIGTQAAVRSTPDGYTLLAVSNTLAVNQWTQTNLPYDTLRDLVAISTFVGDRDVVAVHASLPANNLKEFIAHARQNPGKLNARIAAGTISHVLMLMLMEATGTKFTMVSYKGTGAAIADMLSGAVHLSLTSPANIIPHINTGKLKGMAVSGNKRSPALPDVPTLTESGLRDLPTGWFMLLAPAATPRDIVEKMNSHVGRALTSKDVQESLAKAGFEVFANSVAATNALLRSDLESFGKVVKEHNVKAEDG